MWVATWTAWFWGPLLQTAPAVADGSLPWNLLLGPLGLLVGCLLELIEFRRGRILPRSQLDAALAALKEAHADATRAAAEQHESERALIIQQVADAKDYATRLDALATAQLAKLEADFAARLAHLEEGESYWRDMSLGLLKVADAARRAESGRPHRGGGAA